MNRPLYGLVLSGGRSRRMGRDKALLERNGSSQLAHLVSVLEGQVERVFVSTRGGQQDEERGRFECIEDRYEGMGPLAGILSAMAAHPEADWLVIACDLPNVEAATLRYLLDHAEADAPFTAYASSHDGLPEPLCALYRRESVEILRRYADEGVHCPRKILIRSDAQLLQQADPRWLDNVNTPGDLADSVLGGDA